MEDFKKLIKEKENPRRKGFDSKSKTWKPHKSAEGGTDTIGWGHKLTPAEQAGGYVVIGKEKVPFNELTEAKNNALFEQDWNNNTQLATTFINEKGDWNSLSEPQKLVSTELFFNMGPNKAKQFKTFRDKIIAQDEGFIEEINRTYTNPEGKTRSLTERTDPIKAWYRGQTKKEEAPGKQSSVFTGEKINVAGTDLDGIFTNEIESQYGKRPKEVIKETETVAKETPNFYANQNLPNAPQDLGVVELPPDQIITPYRETIKEDVTVRPDQIRTTETISVSEPDMYKNYRMQEAARRSMMQGNYEERMADYENARYNAQQNPGSYPARIVEPTPPPMQAAQRMMGGRMRYAQGGTINQAQGLASLGRGGDSMMVHMQPQEVAGLQQMAQANGTSLTRNPMTGMPEAFSLGGMFRAALPIAAGYFSGGAGAGLAGSGIGFSSAASNAIAAGALTGAGVAAVANEDPIMGAVSGGMGGYSGMGLESAVANMPAATVPMSGNMGQQIAADAAYTGSLGGMQVGTPTANIGAGGTGMNIGGGGFGAQGSAVNDPMMLAGSKPGGTIMQDSPLSTFDRAIEGAKTASGKTDFINRYDPLPGGGLEQASKFTPGTTPQALMKLGSPAASLGLGGLEQSDFEVDVDFDDPRDKYDPYSKLNLNKDTGIRQALATDTGLRLFAEGGNVAGDQKQALNLNSGSNVAGNNAGLRGLNLNTGMMGVSAADLAAAAIAAKPKTPPMKLAMGQGLRPEDAIMQGPAQNYDRLIDGSYRKRYAQGGYLKGPGDGMSDDIPATINGEQPAALADGEFVVPADVVSHLGNGSSEAGSKQLYAMMDRIRKARTGRESQGKEIKPGKYMPR